MEIISDFWQEHNKLLGEYADVSVFKIWKLVREIPIYNPDELAEGYGDENIKLLETSKYREKWTEIIKSGEPFKGHIKESYESAMRHLFLDIPTSVFIMKTIHHVLAFESMMEKSIIDYDTIIEFGAGIGETARVILDGGFEGQYIIVDLPNIARISKYYLSEYNNVSVLDNLNALDYHSYDNQKTLFIATWSLSEVPFDLRGKVAERIKGVDQLIIFQNKIFGYENGKFFYQTWPYITNTFQRFQEMNFHQADLGNFYLIAKGFS